MSRTIRILSRIWNFTSFDVMNIVCAFEEHFDTTIPTRDVWNMHQVKDVLDYIRQRGYSEP